MITAAGPSWFQFVLLLAGSAVLVEALKSLVNRRKVKADVSDVLSGNALEQMTAMRGELNEMRDAVKLFKAALYDHERWDRRVLKRLNELDPGGDIPNPPELWI